MNRSLGPIRDPDALAGYLRGLRDIIPPDSDVACAMLFRSEIALLLHALEGVAATRHRAKDFAEKLMRGEGGDMRIGPEPEDEPLEIVRTYLPQGKWIDPRQPGADPLTERASAGPLPSASAPPTPSCSPRFGQPAHTLDIGASTAQSRPAAGALGTDHSASRR